MKKRFTEDDLIRFTYDELSKEEGNQLVDALCQDEELLNEYEQYQETVDHLKKLEVNPSDASCMRIMDFVSATNPHDDSVLEGAPAPAVKAKKTLRQRMSVNTVLMTALILFGAATVLGSVYQLYTSQTGYTESQPVEQSPTTEPTLDWEEGDEEIEKLRKEIEQYKKEQHAPTTTEESVS